MDLGANGELWRLGDHASISNYKKVIFLIKRTKEILDIKLVQF